MQTTHKKIKMLLSERPTDHEVTVKGWVRTRRGSKNVAFIALNDGSTIKNLQVVADLQQIPEASSQPGDDRGLSVGIRHTG